MMDDLGASAGPTGLGGAEALERWRTSARFPRYEVSNLGSVRIKDTLRRVASQWCGSGRYRKVALFYDGERFDVTVHQLVAETFLGPRKDGLVIAHLNNDGTDNRSSNLAWVTPQENESHKPSVVSADDRRKIAAAAGTVKQTLLADHYGISLTTVQRIQRHSRKDSLRV